MSLFWRVIAAWSEYKTPLEYGRIIIPQDMFAEGYAFDPSGIVLRFDDDKQREPRVVGDFSGWRPGVFYLSERAFIGLRPMLELSGTAYSLPCGDLPYRVVTIDRTYDAFDYGRGFFERWDQSVDPKRRISDVKRVVLRSDFATDADLFRLQGDLLLRYEIIASDAFRREYDRNGLSGLIFQRADQ